MYCPKIWLNKSILKLIKLNIIKRSKLDRETFYIIQGTLCVYDIFLEMKLI